LLFASLYTASTESFLKENIMETNLVTTTEVKPEANTTVENTANTVNAAASTASAKTSHKLRNFLIVCFVMFAIAAFGLMSIEDSVILIDGEEVSGISGFGGAVLACLIACLAVVFAIGVTGVALLGVAALLVVVAAVVIGSVILAMLPLLFPALLLIGILMFFSRRKKNMEKSATANASV
jgi:hypothetical protein